MPLCAALWAISASAQAERILDFHSDIRVQGDSTMEVVETIRVVSAGNQIRHGIYRDFPTRYSDGLGNRYVVRLEVTAATRDGIPEVFRIEDHANGKRMYLLSELVPQNGSGRCSVGCPSRRFAVLCSHHG